MGSARGTWCCLSPAGALGASRGWVGPGDPACPSPTRSCQVETDLLLLVGDGCCQGPPKAVGLLGMRGQERGQLHGPHAHSGSKRAGFSRLIEGAAVDEEGRYRPGRGGSDRRAWLRGGVLLAGLVGCRLMGCSAWCGKLRLTRALETRLFAQVAGLGPWGAASFLV